MTKEAAEQLARQTGFSHWGIFPVEGLKFLPEVRAACADNKCGAYNKSWSCPPACGTIEECEARAKRFGWGILLQTTGEMEDDFDVDVMIASEQIQKERFDVYCRAIDLHDLCQVLLSGQPVPLSGPAPAIYGGIRAPGDGCLQSGEHPVLLRPPDDHIHLLRAVCRSKWRVSDGQGRETAGKRSFRSILKGALFWIFNCANQFFHASPYGIAFLAQRTKWVYNTITKTGPYRATWNTSHWFLSSWNKTE